MQQPLLLVTTAVAWTASLMLMFGTQDEMMWGGYVSRVAVCLTIAFLLKLDSGRVKSIADKCLRAGEEERPEAKIMPLRQ